MLIPILKKYGPAVTLLVITTTAAMFMLHYRVQFADEAWQFLFFPWNLFLAWIPFILSLILCSVHDPPLYGWRKLIWWALACVWLLFFPNAPYLLTDLIHLNNLEFIVWDGPHLVFNPDLQVWYDLVMFSLFIGTGMLLGCLSLHQMHMLVRRTKGAIIGWMTTVLIVILSGYGIFLGRFNRLNSWDIMDLSYILREIANTLTWQTAAFVLLFSGFLFAAYSACYLLVTMQGDDRSSTVGSRGEQHV